MRGQCGRWAAIAVLFVLCAARAAAADVALTYVGPAEACPDEATVRAALEADLPWTATVTLQLDATPDGFTGTATAIAASRERLDRSRGPSRDCATIADELIADVRGHIASVPARRSVEPLVRRPPRGELYAGGGVVDGSFPDFVPLFVAGGRVRRDRWLIGGRVRLSRWERDQPYWVGDHTVLIVDALIDVCLRRGVIDLCGVAGASMKHTDDEDYTLTYGYGSAGARAALHLPIGGGAAVSPAIEVLAPLSHTTFVSSHAYKPSVPPIGYAVEASLVIFLNR